MRVCAKLMFEEVGIFRFSCYSFAAGFYCYPILSLVLVCCMWVEVLVNQGGCEVGSELGNVLCICSVESMEVEDASEVDVKLEVRFYHVFPMVKHVVVGSFGLDHIKSDVVSPDLPVRG
ncbi:hypothetical protein U1Q18_032713 [Sarracenia purpurea var. burkii]